MLSFHRASFRQLLVVAFLLVAALLAAASLHGLFTLERLIAQSRDGAERAVMATAAVQTLAERSVVMERAARQYLVLDEAGKFARREPLIGRPKHSQRGPQSVGETCRSIVVADANNYIIHSKIPVSSVMPSTQGTPIAVFEKVA